MDANLPPYSPGYGLATEDSHVDTSAGSMHASLTNSCWSSSQVSSIHQNPLFSLQNRVSDLDYPSPASSVPSPPYQPQSHQHAAVNNSAITSDKAITSSFPQVEPVIGPDRVMTRRQRAAHDQSILGRRLSVPSNFTRDLQGPLSHHRSDHYFSSTAGSRPQTPETAKAHIHRNRLSLSIDNALLSNHSPSYKPMTPTSLSSPYSPFPYYSAPLRSEPGAQPTMEPRTESPSNSITSSVSLTGTPYEGGPIRTSATSHAGVPARVKHKKQRLCNKERKDICEYAEKNPNARQEDMAVLWKVERSTVSKILKHKEKWLRLPQDSYNTTISKHRNSKFPEIEADLEPWLNECHNQQIAITDALIRNKAKEVAQKRNISDDKFKASSGWIENFKLRQGIKNGKLTGDGKDAHIRHIYATINQHNIAEDASPSLRGPTLQTTDSRLSNGSMAYQHPSWPSYPQTTRMFPLLDAPSILSSSSPSEQHIRTDGSFPTQMLTDQQATSDYNSVPTLEQALEALRAVRLFLDTYHRREYLINEKDNDVLVKTAQRFTAELAGTIIDKV